MTISKEEHADMLERSRKDRVIEKVKTAAEEEGLTLIFVGCRLYGIDGDNCTFITEGADWDDAYAKAVQIPAKELRRNGFNPLSVIENEKWSIPHNTVVPEGLKIPPRTWTGARCTLSKGVVVGDRFRLGKQSIVGEGCIIGNDWLIGKDSLIMPDVRLGTGGEVAYNATFDVHTIFDSPFEVNGGGGIRHTVEGNKPWKVGMFTWDDSPCYITLTELPYSSSRSGLKTRVSRRVSELES